MKTFTAEELEKLRQELTLGINDPEKAKHAINIVVDTIETMAKSLNDMRASNERFEKISLEYKAVAENQIKACDALVTTIKNVHIAINAEPEISEKLSELNAELAKFVLSPMAIRSGVSNNAND